MSLRSTLVFGLGLVLLFSLACGGVLVYWHAVDKVATEMNAALVVGEQTIRNAVANVRQDAPAPTELTAIVKGLDGDRHLRAAMLSADGSVLIQSTPLPSTEPAPGWFYKLLARRPAVRRIVVPGRAPYAAILLETDAHNEIGEAWSDAILTLTVLALFCSLSALLSYWMTGRMLRSLNAISLSFRRVGAGDYATHVAEWGPHELQELSVGFNEMVARLADMSRRKDRLEEQLVEVQEEERSELARDLHDEVGPLLFAVSVDLTALQQHEAIRSDAAINGRLSATHDAVSRMQQHVKAILGRLRSPTVADLGLARSVETLASFWRTRYPLVTFDIEIAEEGFDVDVSASMYRIIQESVSNALRHGHPKSIELRVVREDTSMLVEVRDDGVGLPPDRDNQGLGLTGMRERVSSLNGELEVASGPGGRGVRVTARLPIPRSSSFDAMTTRGEA
jgi:two-component system, NarL family, sensor histidine kinase UhpB